MTKSKPMAELLSPNNLSTLSHFELRWHNVPSKIFCGIANCIGHLISDVSGSSSSKGRGMGIPSPILAWSNDIIVIREIIEKKQKIPISEFAKSFAELAVKMFEKGYDVRFQTAQAIPVFINEMVVRLILREILVFRGALWHLKISIKYLKQLSRLKNYKIHTKRVLLLFVTIS